MVLLVYQITEGLCTVIIRKPFFSIAAGFFLLGNLLTTRDLPRALENTMEISADFVWKCFERSVVIQITNKTQDATLNNPR